VIRVFTGKYCNPRPLFMKIWIVLQ